MCWKDTAHFSLWLKEGHGGVKSATKTEDAEGYQIWNSFMAVQDDMMGLPLLLARAKQGVRLYIAPLFTSHRTPCISRASTSYAYI
jgi:hypothetical protein